MGMANHVQTSSSWPHSPPTLATFRHRGNVPCDYLHNSPARWASLQNTQRNAYTQLSCRARSDDSGSAGRSASAPSLAHQRARCKSAFSLRQGSKQPTLRGVGLTGRSFTASWSGYLDRSCGKACTRIRTAFKNSTASFSGMSTLNTRRKYPSSGKENVPKLLPSLPPREKKEPIVARKPQWQYQASIQGNHSSGP